MPGALSACSPRLPVSHLQSFAGFCWAQPHALLSLSSCEQCQEPLAGTPYPEYHPHHRSPPYPRSRWGAEGAVPSTLLCPCSPSTPPFSAPTERGCSSLLGTCAFTEHLPVPGLWLRAAYTVVTDMAICQALSSSFLTEPQFGGRGKDVSHSNDDAMIAGNGSGYYPSTTPSRPTCGPRF